jgi:pimeloyl-ACP methyl ester carboxylesterase
MRNVSACCSIAAGATLAALTMMSPGPAIAQGTAADLAASSIGGLRAKLIDVNGIQARYYEAGRGEPLLLLHGGRRTVFNSANMWTRNIPGLAEHFHVIALDRLGFGMSGARPDNDFRYDREVEFVDEFLETMNLDRVNIAGNSSGGAVALLYGLTHPDKVESLVLVAVGPETVNPSPSKGDIMREACNNLSGRASWQCWMSAMAWRHDGTFDEEFWRASEHIMSMGQREHIAERQAQAPQEAPDFWARQRDRIRSTGAPGLPILWVCGSHDTLDWKPQLAESDLAGCVDFYHTLGAKNSDVKLIVYNQAGHFLYREYPEKFNTDVVDFIASVEDRS